MKKMGKRALLLMAVMIVMVMLPMSAMAVLNVTTADELVSAMNSINTHKGDLIININKDIDVSGKGWSAKVNANNGTEKVTVNGNGYTITGMTNPLIDATWAGKTAVEINNLTISGSEISVDPQDAAENIGVGAFIGGPQASRSIVLNNCHLANSTVEGGHWTGGLIGWAGGYNGNDGPVFMDLQMNNCSVTGSTVKGKGSVGGLIGFASSAEWTKVTIKSCEVSSNIITSNDSSNKKAGDLIGTIGAAGHPKEVNGETKTGGVVVESFTANKNEVTSNGTKIQRIFGRFGNSLGVLTVSGNNVYDEEAVDGGWDKSGDVGTLNTNGATLRKPMDPAAPAVPGNEADVEVNMPSTGDNSSLLFFAALLALSGAGLMLLKKRSMSR